MHTLTLVTVDVPTQLEVTMDVDTYRELLENYKSDKPKSDFDSIMVDFGLRRATSRRDAFSCAVDDAIAEKMELYCECTEDRQYLEFENENEVIRHKYENETQNFLKHPDGRIEPANCQHFYEIRDGVVWQRKAGSLHHPMRTKKAKKIKALVDYPFRKAYKTFDKFATDYYGITYDEEHEAYGYYYNPNAFWDWYSIGGRWPATFLVKETCKEYSIGERRMEAKMPDAPEGYIWVIAARKKDIEWQVAFEWKRENMKKQFFLLEECFKKGEIPNDMCATITEKGIGLFGDMYYIAGESLDENLKRLGYAECHKYHASAGAFLGHDGEYIDRYDILGANEDKDLWVKHLDKFVDEVDDETVIVAVDCHI